MEHLIFGLDATMPIFFLMVLGACFKKAGIVEGAFADKVNQFVFKVALPVLLFEDLSNSDFSRVWDTRFVMFCFASTLGGTLLAILLSMALKDRRSRGELIQVSYRSSAALLGIAFIKNIYGDVGMAPPMIIDSAPLHNVTAVMILSFIDPEGVVLDRRMLGKTVTCIPKNPIILGILTGMARSLLGLKQPQIMEKAVSSLVEVAIPLGPMAIGVSFDFRQTSQRVGAAAGASAIRLVPFCIVFLPVAACLGFRERQLVAILVMLGSAATASCLVVARSMGREGVLNSSVVAITTYGSVFTLTLWLDPIRTLGLTQEWTSPGRREQMKAKLEVIGSIAAFGTIGASVRHVPPPPGELALYRALIATGAIFLWQSCSGQGIGIKDAKAELHLLISSGAAIGINWILFFKAHRYTMVAMATLSYCFAPVIVTVANPFLFKEKFTAHQMFCFIMSTLGLVLVIDINRGGSSSDLIGTLFGLGVAVFYASVVLLNKNIRHVSGINRTFLQFLAAILVLTSYVCLTGGSYLLDMDALGMINLLVVEVLHTGTCCCVYFSSLRYLKGQEASILSYIDSLVAILVPVTFLHETITVFQAVGRGVILGFMVVSEVRMRAGGGDPDPREAAVLTAHPLSTCCTSDAPAISSLPGKEKNISCQSVVKITPY